MSFSVHGFHRYVYCRSFGPSIESDRETFTDQHVPIEIPANNKHRQADVYACTRTQARTQARTHTHTHTHTHTCWKLYNSRDIYLLYETRSNNTNQYLSVLSSKRALAHDTYISKRRVRTTTTSVSAFRCSCRSSSTELHISQRKWNRPRCRRCRSNRTLFYGDRHA